MAHGTHTHWQMTINNYDETDLALVQQGYPDHIAKLVYTLEEGEEGTPHVQAFIKMKRDCRLSHMKKLFPRGHFGYLDTLEFKLNAERYAQKTDPTTRSAHTIINGDPLHTIEGIIRVVCQRIVEEYDDEEDLSVARRWVEVAMVREDYTMAKVFVSATYKAMWKEFGHEMFQNVRHTHTHTHTQVSVVEVPTVEIISQQDDITNGHSRILRQSPDLGSGKEDEEEDGTEGDGSSSTEGGSSDGEDSDCSGA